MILRIHVKIKYDTACYNTHYGSYHYKEPASRSPDEPDGTFRVTFRCIFYSSHLIIRYVDHFIWHIFYN